MPGYTKTSEKKYSISDGSSGYDKKLVVKKYELPSGVEETFIVDNDKNSVQIFALTEEQQVITVIQFRPGSEKEEIELPGGGIETEEPEPSRSAYRELLEETGHKGNLTFLGVMNYSPYSTGKRYMFMATECRKVAKLDLDPNEFLTVKLWSLDEFRELMKKGKVRGTDLAYMALDRLNLL